MIPAYSLFFGLLCGYLYASSLTKSVAWLATTSVRLFSYTWLIRYFTLGMIVYGGHQYAGVNLLWWLCGFFLSFAGTCWHRTRVLS